MKQIDATHITHAQIAENNIHVLIDIAHSLVGVLRNRDGEPLGLQNLGDRSTFGFGVFHHQNSSRFAHKKYPFARLNYSPLTNRHTRTFLSGATDKMAY